MKKYYKRALHLGTRRGRLKSALYLSLKKRKTFFWKKNLKFLKNFLSENVSVPKNVKGGHFLIYKYTFCCKITKNSKGGPFGDIKIFEKKVGAEKIERGDLLVSAGSVGYVKKVKNERRDLLETKNFSKICTVPEKNRKGESLVPSGFVGYPEKVKNEKGDPLH